MQDKVAPGRFNAASPSTAMAPHRKKISAFSSKKEERAKLAWETHSKNQSKKAQRTITSPTTHIIKEPTQSPRTSQPKTNPQLTGILFRSLKSYGGPADARHGLKRRWALVPVKRGLVGNFQPGSPNKIANNSARGSPRGAPKCPSTPAAEGFRTHEHALHCQLPVTHR